MSESTGTPAAPSAPAPAPLAPSVTTQPGAAPAPAAPSISVSEAARALNARRQEARQEAQGAPPQPRTQAPTPDAGAPAPPAPATGSDAMDAMAKALGLPDGAQPTPPTPGSTPTPTLGPSVEIEGRHFTQDQLRTAVLQAQDYTRKTQALAEQTRAIQQQQEALAAVLPLIQPELQRLQQQSQVAPPPDPALAQTDPTRYIQEFAAYEASQRQAQRLGQLTTLQQEALNRAMAEQVDTSNKVLTDRLPGWGDPKMRGEWQSSIASWAMEHGGFQRNELQGLADHRQLLAMAKAMMWDRMVSSAKTSAPQQAPPARGTAPAPPPTQRIGDAEQRFSERATIRNATALLTARRANGTGR